MNHNLEVGDVITWNDRFKDKTKYTITKIHTEDIIKSGRATTKEGDIDMVTDDGRKYYGVSSSTILISFKLDPGYIRQLRLKELLDLNILD